MKRLLFISNLGILIVLNLIWTVNTVYFTDDFKLIFEQPTRGVIECLGAIVSIKDAYALDNEVMDYTGDYRTAYNIQQAYQQDQRNLPQAGLASTQLNTSPLSLSIGGQTYQVQRLMPGQSATGTSGSAVGVIYEDKTSDNWFGHSAIRIGTTVYDLEKISHDRASYRERSYQDVLNDSPGQIEVRLNHMTQYQVKQLETNLRQRVGLKEPFPYDFFNNNCVNMVENELSRIGVQFPNNLVEIPFQAIDQARQFNQTTKAPMIDWRQRTNPSLSSSNDLKRSLQPVAEFGHHGLIGTLGSIPAVRDYLDRTAREFSQLRANTPVNLINSSFQSMDFSQIPNYRPSPAIKMPQINLPNYRPPVIQPVTTLM